MDLRALNKAADPQIIGRSVSQWRAFLLTTFVGLMCVGCGHCAQVDESRTAFLKAQEQIRNDGRPQMRIDIPTKLVYRWLNEMVSDLPAIEHRLDELGQLGQYLDALILDPRKVRLNATKTRVKFELDVDVRLRDRVLFGLELAADAPVQYNQRTGVMEVRLEGKNFARIEPRLTANAVPNLTRSLRSLLPAVVRPLFSKPQVEDMVRQGLMRFQKKVVALLRQRVLDPMGTLATLRFQVPNIPVERAILEADRGQYTVSLWSTISSPGLPPRGRRPAKENVRISFAVPAVVALGNWAMERGFIPNRFGLNGRPEPHGPLVASLEWQSGIRPLKVHLWSERTDDSDNVCLYVKAGAAPKARLRREQLSLSFEDAHLEEVVGPPPLNEALTVLGVSKHAFQWSKTIALKTDLRIGKRVDFEQISTLKLDEHALTFEFVAKPGQ